MFWNHTRPDAGRFDAMWTRARERYAEIRPDLRIMPGIADELPALAASFRVGIAGQYGGNLLEALEQAGLVDCLAWRFTQDDFDITKPDPRYLLRIADACGVEPTGCIMVGDRIDKDVVPARQVGMATILVRGGLHLHQQPRLPEEVPDAELWGVRGLAKAAEALASG